jgi:putative protease
MTQPELLAPAGNWDCLRAAVANGADAVYFGLPRFNARLRADNFTEAELPEVVRFCHLHGVKAYVAFNTLVFTDELADAADYLRLLNRAGVDALIVQDYGLAQMARRIVPELHIHASTQMTITSPEGVAFAETLGIKRVVLARELSLRELKKFGTTLPLEVFVHGALCVAYSGQCLTSESLGQRSANRGECAQACRMPYELVVDGETRDFGDKRYLLSPQDLAAAEEIPELMALGVESFKIEGRLKSPEYVAAVCQVYRKAIDAALNSHPSTLNQHDRYQLEMTFSRGLFSGWMHGVNHQRLVSARYGKKRGPFVGPIVKVGRDHVEVDAQIVIKPGDGIVFDTGGDTNDEQGGRIYSVKANRLFFQHGHLDFARLKAGDRIWKTDDPALNAELRKSFAGQITARHRVPLDLRVSGEAGNAMRLEVVNGLAAAVESAKPLDAARTSPLTGEKLREHFGRFGGTAYELRELRNELAGDVILPIGEMNRMRRELVYQLDALRDAPRPEIALGVDELLAEVAAPASNEAAAELTVLCRAMDQLEAALAANVKTVLVDFEDIRRYKDAVVLVRGQGSAEIFLATPRIQKAGEQGFFKLIENAQPDGVLVRNLGAIEYFAERGIRRLGDFSLNVANPLTASLLMARGMERLTASYDLNIEQLLALLRKVPRGWFEITLHQHMPMFHMEHCVFAAFLSKGTDHTNCGRPCDSHRVHLRDRVGIEHPLRADVGCRNTLFNATPQTGAQFYSELRLAGVQRFRVELLEESAAETARVIGHYHALLRSETGGEMLWRELRAQSQLGVTRGTL